jgi:tRNA/rRNA methyltransferase
MGTGTLSVSKKTGALPGFAVAIVEPEFGINVGYLARTSANFGLKKLFIVSRRKLSAGNLSAARLYAAHGKHLVNEVTYLSTFDALKRRFKILIGTTAIEARRKSNLTRRNLGPEDCARAVLGGMKGKSQIGACFVFGRDTTGLTNEELKKCDYTLTIRTLSDYNTLNISHAAAIVLYTFASMASFEKIKKNGSFNASTTRKERERVVTLFLQLAKDSEFQEFKTGLLRQSVERILNRSDPSLRELYLLMGLASRADLKLRRLSAEDIPSAG